MKRTKPALVFSPTGRYQGFNAKAMSSVDDLQPTRFVRELLQNALDAGVEAGRPVVRVRFEVTTIRGKEIPDLEGYERVLEAALETHGKPADRAEVVSRMRRALEDGRPDGEGLWCLSILDNGIGLDGSRMTGILGDGAPRKGPDSLGSFGVGHFAPMATSDLRYALYGGLQKGGQRIASGMAVIASHRVREGKGQDSRSGFSALRDGYGQLAAGDERGADGAYKPLTGKSIPGLVGRGLDYIAQSWEHGTAVVIPAFNYFNAAPSEDDSYLHRLVPKVAAYNFHPAIEAGRLVIEVDETEILDEEDNGHLIVDKDGLGRVLEEDQHRARTFRADGFHAGLRPAGRHAYSAWRTVVGGTSVRIPTSGGTVDARILVDPPCGDFRVDLFRDGMWIADRLPGLQASDFTDRKPFHVVLLLDRGDGADLVRLVHKAEGPDHDRLDLARLSRERQERAKLLNLFREIREAIRQNTPEEETDEYTADDFLAVATGGGPGGTGQSEYAFWGSPVVVSRVPTRGSRNKPDPDPEVRTKRKRGSQRSKEKPPVPRAGRSARNVPVNATVVPEGSGKHLVSFECREPAQELELSLVVDENTDATCDRVWPDERVTLEVVEINVSSDHGASPGMSPQAVVAPGGQRGDALRSRTRRPVPVHGSVLNYWEVHRGDQRFQRSVLSSPGQMPKKRGPQSDHNPYRFDALVRRRTACPGAGVSGPRNRQRELSRGRVHSHHW